MELIAALVFGTAFLRTGPVVTGAQSCPAGLNDCGMIELKLALSFRSKEEEIFLFELYDEMLSTFFSRVVLCGWTKEWNEKEDERSNRFVVSDWNQDKINVMLGWELGSRKFRAIFIVVMVS